MFILFEWFNVVIYKSKTKILYCYLLYMKNCFLLWFLNFRIQSVMCEHDDDLCYSMHTPFGIIDRGCYNSNHNLTTYVCSCNLCNYISISEMPYTFNTKQDWIDNVIEISRTRHFRKSIFKDMSCLRCEVNSTVQKADLIESANCLEGSM